MYHGNVDVRMNQDLHYVKFINKEASLSESAKKHDCLPKRDLNCTVINNYNGAFGNKVNRWGGGIGR